MFDANDLKNYTTTQQGATRIKPIPEGEWLGQIKEVIFRQSEGKKASTQGQLFIFMDVTFLFDDPRIKEATGRDNPQSRMGVSVDLTPDGRALDMGDGKNVNLNRLREAVGQNREGQPWSPTMLEGQVCLCKVQHRPDPDDPQTIYDRVAAVAPLR